jgi:hypothetical protein
MEFRGVDGRIILKWMLVRLDGGHRPIDLAQDGDMLRDHLYAVVNFHFPFFFCIS